MAMESAKTWGVHSKKPYGDADVATDALHQLNGLDRTADNDEQLQRTERSSVENDGIFFSGTEDAGKISCDANPQVTGIVPTTKTFDRLVSALIHKPDTNLYFDQWKRKMNSKSAVKRLRMALEELLPRLIGGRDYAGASKVLEVMYHRFSIIPALCIEASLEILRRQPDYRDEMLKFYEGALRVERIDKALILKEMWLFQIVHGEFYEAYHFYQDKLSLIEEFENDARLLANFGILCYWLMLIESKELRDTLKREDMGCHSYEDKDETSLFGNEFCTRESLESVIESNFLFKTPIGPHILYQHASNALRRAGALCPRSAMFVEFYVQLLVLVGDIQPACDYLETFYHMNPGDPHGPRMLARYLNCYFPDSVDAQVAVLLRWTKDDPSCNYPLEKLLELSSAGAVSSYVLTKVLVDALDVCGSDLYVVKNPSIALALWRNLAELVAAMDEDEFLLDQIENDLSDKVTLAEVGAQRLWWKRVYFAKPSSVEEVVTVARHDGIFMKISIYRAAVAERFFPGPIPMTYALRSAMVLPDVTYSIEHVRLFKSFFPSASRTTSNSAACRPFYSKPFINSIVDRSTRKTIELPIFEGSSDSIRVIDRSSIFEKENANEKTEVGVTRSGKCEIVDQRFVEELYQALDGKDCNLSLSTRPYQQKRKIDAISSSTPAMIPAFAKVIEEEVYNNPDATLRHIYSTIFHKFRRSDILVPTLKSVAHCVVFFKNRYRRNDEDYGHGGVLMRYEEFIVTYMRRRKLHGLNEITIDVANAVVDEMTRVLPSPHSFLPDVEVVKKIMHRKIPMLLRERRLRLIELKKTLLPVLRQLVYVEDTFFANAVFSVIEQSGLLGVLTRVDIAHTVEKMLPTHYYRVLQTMRPLLLKHITSAAFRVDCGTAEEIFKKIKRQKPRIEEVKALLWVERYEVLNGLISHDRKSNDNGNEYNNDSRSRSNSENAKDSDDSY